MKIHILFLFVKLFCSWEVLPYSMDNSVETGVNPFYEIVNPMMGLQCRKGFNNLSEEVYDAVNHCANIKRPKESRLVFSREKVQFDGPTPRLCMASCYVRELGVINEQSTGFNEAKLLAYLMKWMTRSGGEASAKQVTKELIGCEKIHPVLFPKVYKNCTDTEEFFRCTRKVLDDCRDKNLRDDINVNRAFAYSEINIDSSRSLYFKK